MCGSQVCISVPEIVSAIANICDSSIVKAESVPAERHTRADISRKMHRTGADVLLQLYASLAGGFVLCMICSMRAWFNAWE